MGVRLRQPQLSCRLGTARLGSAGLGCTAPPAEPRRPKPEGRARSLFIGRFIRSAAGRPLPLLLRRAGRWPRVRRWGRGRGRGVRLQPPVQGEARRGHRRRLKGKARAEQMAPPCARAAYSRPWGSPPRGCADILFPLPLSDTRGTVADLWPPPRPARGRP